jgi:hypothetical protein
LYARSANSISGSEPNQPPAESSWLVFGYSVKVVAFSNAEESFAISSIVSSSEKAVSLDEIIPPLST